jgi:hypothetical protein
MVALVKNDIKPRLTPLRSLKLSLRRLRTSMTALMSISLKVVSIAAVCWASTSRRAIVWRRRDIRTRSSRSAAGAAGAGVAACAAGRAAGAGGGSRCLTTSSFVTRPPGPDPLTCRISTARSEATLRATGVT